MVKKPVLIVLTDSYPLTYGEFFLDDELKVIAGSFDKIVVVTEGHETTATGRYIPDNLIIYHLHPDRILISTISTLRYFFTEFFISEFGKVVKKFKFGHWLSLGKIMYRYIVKAAYYSNFLKKLASKPDLHGCKLFYYSYWNDYRALALSLMKKEYPHHKYFSRAHGWDVFADRQKPAYLPFKFFILKSIDHVFCVSEAGKKELLNYADPKAGNRISVSRLGKLKTSRHQGNKPDGHFLFCSCSNLIPLKRVYLIIELISNLKLNNVSWVHFGDGPLRANLEAYAGKFTNRFKASFRGKVNNEEILHFYGRNYVDLFINVSESEGIPYSIIEAMSAGIPVMATHTGGVSEIVNNNNGFLIDKHFDVLATAKLIEDFLRSSPENINNYRDQAFRTWLDHYEANTNYSGFVSAMFHLDNKE